MKKLFSILLALTLCLCSLTALAESEVPVVEMPISYEAGVLPLGETGLVFSLPVDWLIMETPEGALAAYQDAEGTIGLTITLIAEDITVLAEQCVEAVNNGLAASAGPAIINNVNLYLYTPGDGLTDVAYLGVTDGATLCFVFTAASEEIYNSGSTLPLEILGSIALAE